MQSSKTKMITMVALFAAVICILGPLSVALPMTPVPICFTNLGICLAAVTLGWKYGTLSCLIYLMLGFAGLPVFVGFTSGPGKLLGPTGGYLLGFIFLALIGGWFSDHFKNQFWMSIVGLLIGTVTLYAFGTAWLSVQMHLTPIQALMAGVIPYIPGDLIKIYLSVMLGCEIKKRIKVS